MRATGWLESFVQDLRYGARSFTRSPLLAIAVILTLGLGIGLSTAVFTVINGFFFRARVEKDPSTFVQFVPLYSGEFERAQGMLFSTSLEDFRVYQERTRSLQNLTAWSNVPATIDDDPTPIMPLLVTAISFRCMAWSTPSSADYSLPMSAPLLAPPPLL
jgi:hypothetical protein